jgi:hypothetical protein
MTQNDSLTIAGTGLEFPLGWLPDWVPALLGDDSMASRVVSRKTAQGYEDVIVGAQRFFATEGWRTTGQSARTTTFLGKPQIPGRVLALTAAGFLAFVVPGVVLYRRGILKRYGFSNIVVSTTPIKGGTQVVVEYPPSAEAIAKRFMETLPAAT